ncbi:putative Restriction enzyme subunit alpha [Escherichia coli]|nr:putative Restriction enzyme subunit alpha [Escherichia coli]
MILCCQTSDQRPATSDQRPATSDQRPATSDQRPATSDQRPATSDQRPATSDQRPATSDQRPATSDQRPATSDQRPATSDQRPATSKLRKAVKSVEPDIAELGNGWLKSYGLDYKLEQATLNREIDNALDAYFSKNGGAGGNRPDVKLLLKDKYGKSYPVLIEYKGYKDKLIKLSSNGIIENKDSRKEWNFKNINGYAVNGAVHYANALLQFTSYPDIIAIGMTGWRDEDTGKLHHEIGVWHVSKNNLGAGQKIGEYVDLSFLSSSNFDEFINKVSLLNLSVEELEKIKTSKEEEIDTRLSRLNNDIYQSEKGLGENDRVYLVVATVIATLGIPGKLSPLDKRELVSSTEEGERDGDIIFRKVKNFLTIKNVPGTKRDMILRTLQNTLWTENINKPVNGESQLKRVFSKVIDDLGEYYKIGLTTDFTGKLFNEMYRWLGFTQDKLNDVVLTPPYVATLLARLARVNKDSYVWDFATGSAGLLVAAMNEMLIDARDKIKSPDELKQKEVQIKAEQLLGLEVLSSIYMLAILNMILMGDGSANILNKDSLADFDGRYGFGKTGENFPATAFVLNPPYSAKGNGMIFVQKALSMMEKGYAAVIIQGSSGSGKAKEYNRKILKENTLLASIKMPADLFIGKSNVQTYIYVFQVKIPHNAKQAVKFIDFSNDGYTRSNRKKARNNLVDADRAKERYQEVVDLVHFGKGCLNIFTENEYFESVIDPEKGDDWNQTKPVDTRPTLEDFKKTVGDYLAWEVSKIIQSGGKLEKKL